MLKKLIKILLVVIVIALLIVYVPYYFNECDDCGEFFVGAGYEPNIVSELINESEQIICKECAEKHHAISTTLGKSLDDYKRPAFIDPITMFNNRFEILESK